MERTGICGKASHGQNHAFKDNGDCTVTDNLTKLIWLKNAHAFGVRTWEEALADANGLAGGLSGFKACFSAEDWRLPNVKELQSLIDFAFSDPALSDESGKSRWSEEHPFSGVQSNYYWSSTTASDNTTQAWVVGLYDGYVFPYDKPDTYCVWPVRAGR